MPPNFFKIKKLVLLTVTGILPVMAMFVTLFLGMGLLISVGIIIACLLFGIFLFTQLVRHPLLSLAEGEGLMLLTVDSTGVIVPAVVKMNAPKLFADLGGGKTVESIYDRSMIHYFQQPRTGTMDFKKSVGNFDEYTVRMERGREHDITFMFMQYPTFIYNKNTGTFVSKEQWAKYEEAMTVKHTVLYLKTKTEELTSIMRDFARYVVEQLKPKQGFSLGGKWLWIILIGGVIVVIAFLFGPSIMQTGGSVVSSVKQTAIVT